VAQTRVQLRPDQTAALGALAAERGVSISELVRQAVDLLLATDQPESATESAIPLAAPASDTDATDATDDHRDDGESLTSE
jgi:hypothetical protein